MGYAATTLQQKLEEIGHAYSILECVINSSFTKYFITYRSNLQKLHKVHKFLVTFNIGMYLHIFSVHMSLRLSAQLCGIFCLEN